MKSADCPGVLLTLSTLPLLQDVLCRTWKSTGSCLYGDLCHEAHGVEQLNTMVRCRAWGLTGTCRFGAECKCLHGNNDTSLLKQSPPLRPFSGSAPKAPVARNGQGALGGQGGQQRGLWGAASHRTSHPLSQQVGGERLGTCLSTPQPRMQSSTHHDMVDDDIFVAQQQLLEEQEQLLCMQKQQLLLLQAGGAREQQNQPTPGREFIRRTPTPPPPRTAASAAAVRQSSGNAVRDTNMAAWGRGGGNAPMWRDIQPFHRVNQGRHTEQVGAFSVDNPTSNRFTMSVEGKPMQAYKAFVS